MLMAISFLVLLVSFVYATFILHILNIWLGLPINRLQGKRNLNTEVIVPVKNEARNISSCIHSILSNTQQPSTLTIVLDGSTDNSEQLALSSLRSSDKVIHTPASERGKKKAIQLAIDETTADIVLTTDGDCRVSDQWIHSMANAADDSSDSLILGPVFIASPVNLIQHFQQFDLIATMALSQVGHTKKWFQSGSAACMAYSKKLYIDMQPYAGNYHVPSGDDIFFIEKVVNSGLKVNFIKEPSTYVLTEAELNWSDLWRQRLRWAGKSRHYKNSGLNLFWMGIGLVLLTYCLSVVLISTTMGIYVFLTAWVAKGIVDYLLINQLVKFYNLQVNFKYFLISLIVYPIFTLAVAIRSLFFRTTKW